VKVSMMRPMAGIVRLLGSGRNEAAGPGWRDVLRARHYPGYRFPAEIIRHAVWLFHLFSLSFRDIELILTERGIVVSHEYPAVVPPTAPVPWA
jgi:hypothetical protein